MPTTNQARRMIALKKEKELTAMLGLTKVKCVRNLGDNLHGVWIEKKIAGAMDG